MQTSAGIVYFEREGRRNLSQVLRVVKRALSKRPDLRSAKLVIFTAEGEGPALAYGQLQQFEPKIIAVTFPPDFSVRRGNEVFRPRIHQKVRRFFDGVGIKVLTARLPFEQIEGADSHNQYMELIRQAVSVFGGSFSLCIQAVLQACDHGEVEVGERVIGITGDCAAIITASTTRKFLSREGGLIVNEILCKARNLDLTRGEVTTPSVKSGELFDKTTPSLEIPKMKFLPQSKQDSRKK